MSTEKEAQKRVVKKPTKPKAAKAKKFDFNDILIEPAKLTDIISRSEINIKYGSPEGAFGHLPLIAAPMDTVVSLENLHHFLSNDINVCLPRGEYFEKHGNDGAKMIFNSYSLIEFSNLFIKEQQDKYPSHVLIDIANGHMSDLVYVTKKAKEYYGKTMQLMVGNVANPETYKELSLAGADYIRIGIGNGGGCFFDETKVLCSDGYKNIEDINDGDLVLTHTGEFKEVISKLRYASNDEFIELNGIKCTKDHKFLVINKEDFEKINENNYLDLSFWIEAEKIDENVHMLLEMEVDD